MVMAAVFRNLARLQRLAGPGRVRSVDTARPADPRRARRASGVPGVRARAAARRAGSCCQLTGLAAIKRAAAGDRRRSLGLAAIALKAPFAVVCRRAVSSAPPGLPRLAMIDHGVIASVSTHITRSVATAQRHRLILITAPLHPAVDCPC